MMKNERKFEHWVWTELLAFDRDLPDCGAKEYIDTLGFAPDGVCLLLTTLDFAMAHKGMDTEFVLPPDHCSRNGHPANEVRTRQEWTNYDLRTLISELKKYGCKVYYSSFSTTMLDKFHREWVSDHPEVRGVYSWFDGDPEGRGNDICLIKDLADGTPVAELFASRLVRCCLDYGFDGFHGADGCGPAWASATETDMSDAVLAKFLRPEWKVPEFVSGRWDGDLKTYIRRSEWIWANLRMEWIDFLCRQWAAAWKTITGALHRAGLKAVINSANTRGSFDAMYETGINYRMMAETGIDAMVVETVALGLELGGGNVHPHDDYPAVLREIRTFAPQFKLIFLHGIKDVVENWDNLRHAPCAYERELCRLANSYYFNGSTLERAASGLLGCLADGIKKSEWAFIRGLWDTHISVVPAAAGEVTTLHCDDQLLAGPADYTVDGMLSCHDQIRILMEHGVAIETASPLEFADRIPGVRLLPSAHLVVPERIDRLLKEDAVTILMGRADVLAKYFPAGKVLTDSRIAMVIVDHGTAGTVEHVIPGGRWEPGGVRVRFCEYRPRMPVNDGFWVKAASMIHRCAAEDAEKRHLPYAELSKESGCSLQQQRIDGETLRVVVENRNVWQRAKAVVGFSMPVRSVRILTAFPLRPAGMDAAGYQTNENGRFTVALPVPPRGVTVAEITLIRRSPGTGTA